MLALEGKLKKKSERLIAIDLFGKESVEGKWHDSAPERGVGGGIMLHARRPGGPVAAAQNCATHGPLSVATRGRRCTAWSSMRRFDWRLSTRV